MKNTTVRYNERMRQRALSQKKVVKEKAPKERVDLSGVPSVSDKIQAYEGRVSDVPTKPSEFFQGQNDFSRPE